MGAARPKQLAIYGNYDGYYGYRYVAADYGRDGPDPRLGAMRAEWFRGKEVLDIGCNAGQLTAAIAARFGCARVVGIDIDANLVSKARQLVFLTLTLTLTPTLTPP